jgi:hypothetical protein
MVEKDTKQVDKYKANFKQTLEEGGDYLNLSVKINQDLQDVLKLSIIKELIPLSLYFGEYDAKGDRVLINFQRYKVKSILYGCLYQDYKDVLFIKELVENGEYSFKFRTLETLEKFKTCFKENLFSLLKNILSADLEQSVLYKIKLS